MIHMTCLIHHPSNLPFRDGCEPFRFHTALDLIILLYEHIVWKPRSGPSVVSHISTVLFNTSLCLWWDIPECKRR